MLKQYIPEEHKTRTVYEIRFFVDPDGGCAFPCDSKGNLFPMSESLKESYEYCLAHPEKYPYMFNELVAEEVDDSEPAYGVCECGEKFPLYPYYMGACECPKCHTWYNVFGQELNPPETWADGDDWGDDYDDFADGWD